MSLSKKELTLMRRLNRISDDLKTTFSRRDQAIDLLKLALLCHEHALLLGPPGSGKSEIVSRFAAGIDATSFQYLLTRFSEPAELFGPIDLEAFQEGQYRVKTENMLPEAQIAFLDEVFQASSPILNTLLSVVHERVFFNGSERQQVPLISLFGASNELPDDTTLSAFSDRFALRLVVDRVPDESIGDLLEKGWDMERDRIAGDAPAVSSPLKPEQLASLHRRIRDVKIDEIYTQYSDVLGQLRAQGVALSERRMIKGLKLIRGAALLDLRTEARARDFWPLNHMWNELDDIQSIREIVQPLVEEDGGEALDTHRPIEDVVDELELLIARATGLRGDGAVTAHMSALAQVRREVLLYHSDNGELLQRVESAIQSQLEALEKSLV